MLSQSPIEHVSTITGCSFKSNSAQNGGAIAIYFSNTYFKSQITDCSFMSNTAAINGGAVFYKKLGKTTEVVSVISISNNIF